MVVVLSFRVSLHKISVAGSVSRIARKDRDGLHWSG